MLPKETIDEIIKAGTFAASGMNKQPSIIVAVTNKELRDRLSAMNAKIMGINNEHVPRKSVKPVTVFHSFTRFRRSESFLS